MGRRQPEFLGRLLIRQPVETNAAEHFSLRRVDIRQCLEQPLVQFVRFGETNRVGGGRVDRQRIGKRPNPGPFPVSRSQQHQRLTRGKHSQNRRPRTNRLTRVEFHRRQKGLLKRVGRVAVVRKDAIRASPHKWAVFPQNRWPIGHLIPLAADVAFGSSTKYVAVLAINITEIP